MKMDEGMKNGAVCRDLNLRAAMRYAEHGVELPDLAIAGLFSSFDLAVAFTGGLPAAIEWMRTAVDMIENKMLPPPEGSIGEQEQ